MSGDDFTRVRDGIATLDWLEQLANDSPVTFTGKLANVRTILTPKGNRMAFVLVRVDDESTVELVLFTRAYKNAHTHLFAGTWPWLSIKGRVERREQGETKIVAAEITPFGAES